MRFVFNFVTFSPLNCDPFSLLLEIRPFLLKIYFPLPNPWMCSKEFCADFHCEILPIESEKHGRMNPTKKTVSTDFFFKSECDFLWKFNKRGFVLDIISIFTTNFYNYILHLQIGLMFFSEHMNNKIKGDSCFWIGNHFRHGFDFDQIFPLTLLLFIMVLLFNEHAQSIVDRFNQPSHFLTFKLHPILLDNPFPLWLWESLVRLPWFVWPACLLLETCLSRDNDNWFRF